MLRAFGGEIHRHLGDHPLDLLIERHRPIQHVVKDSGDLLAELEIGDGLGFAEHFILGRRRRRHSRTQVSILHCA